MGVATHHPGPDRSRWPEEPAPAGQAEPRHTTGDQGAISQLVAATVNACVILRRNNFDPLLIFSPRVTTYRVLRSVCSVTRAQQRCAPHLRKVRLHLDPLWWTA